MTSPSPAYWTPLRIALWAAAAVLMSLLMGPKFVAAFRPPDGAFLDFSQEWLSAKNYRAGTPVYADQTEALKRHTGMAPAAGEAMLAWNAHPPASILLALPFAGLPYAQAQLAWNLVTFPLVVLSAAAVLREFGVRLRPASVLPAVALTLLCQPVYIQLLQGQLNAVLMALLVSAWVAARRGHAEWAGAAVGVAAAVKLFPAFLLVYFVVNRRWSAVAAFGAAFLAANGVALALFGAGAFETYVREVVPSVRGYESYWGNVSLTGFWRRVFGPAEAGRISPLVRAPEVGRVIVVALQTAATTVVVWACRRAPAGERADRALAAAIVGMLLVSPISWTHYYLLLIVPLVAVWARLPAGASRWAMWAVFAVMWLPDSLPARLTLGPEQGAALAQNRHRPLTPAENLYAVSVAHYALVALFALVLLVPAGRPDDPPEPPGSAGAPPPSEADLDRRLFGPLDGPR